MFTARLPFRFMCSAWGMLLAWPAAGSAAMIPMDQVGPQARSVDAKAYAHVIHVAPGAKLQTVGGALASIKNASPGNRYAVLVAAGTYRESRVRMKPYVDLYGGFAGGDWKSRD